MVTSALKPIEVRPGLAVPPVGAQVNEGVTFRVWAPKHAQVRVATGDGSTTRYVQLERDAAGYFTGRDEHGRAGDTYWYLWDDRLTPDPASRWQPTGVDGPSQVVDPAAFQWRVNDWQRPPLRGRVIYELHVGTFTPAGTFAAAIERLDHVRELGANTIELMPLGDFAGERNWGYDGVMLFAPARCYGTPDELRALVDAAHARGLAVLVDVVYNHLGPCGNVLGQFSDDYFHREGATLWGDGLNFDGPNAEAVRSFFLQNACMWFDEYRVDGLRLDAVHAIKDGSRPHLVTEIAAAAEQRGGFVIAEDERNEAALITPAATGGWGAHGVWADDFHHVSRVALTRENGVHYRNYTGSLEELVTTLREGWYYRGQYFRSWKRARGSDPRGLPPERFVMCISNHDQVGNRPLGDRLSAVVTPEQYRALSVLLCLIPYTPLLFMGQEWAAETPFPFFTDHPGEVGTSMAANRIREFQHHGSTYSAELLARMPDPQAEATFRSAKLDWSECEREPGAQMLALYRAALRLRAEHANFQSGPRETWRVEALGEAGLGLRWRDGEREWALVVALHPGAEMVPPEAVGRWTQVLHSNAVSFGGTVTESGAPSPSPAAVLWRTAER